MHDTEKMVYEIHQCLMDPQFGLCKVVKGHDESLNGNGKMGLKTQIKILWLAACGVWAVCLTIIAKIIRGD